jgi:hypothetical protein
MAAWRDIPPHGIEHSRAAPRPRRSRSAGARSAGAKKTSDGRQRRLARSSMTRSVHPARLRSPLPQLSPCLWGKCEGAGGRVNASIFLHPWIGCGVANHVVRAGSQSGLRLVLLALETSRNLFGAACRRYLLCLGAADGEWSSFRSQRVYGRASHAVFRVAGNGYESREWEIRCCGDQ